MLTITQTPKADHVLVTLSGIVDEDATFEGIQPLVALPMKFDCSGIKRFNSIGIKMWIMEFEKLRDRKIVFDFFSCPPLFVEQLNNFANFNCGGRVRSIQVPFTCGAFGNQFSLTCDLAVLKAPVTVIPDSPCPNCKAPASFDDLVEEYFSFINRG